MFILPFLISFLIGNRLLRFFLPRGDESLKALLSFGLGAGISAQIVFLTLIIFGQYLPVVIILAHALMLLILYCFKPKEPANVIEFPSLVALLILFFLLAFIMIAALSKPYGDWDAWALWNFRANYICRSMEEWKSIFAFDLHGHRPWLLPFYTVFGWSMAGGEDVRVPMMTAVIFTLSILGILYSRSGLIATVFLFSIPFFISHAVSQYADILVAFYLLAAVVLLKEGLFKGCINHCLFAGVFLGFAAFSKGEGFVFAVLLLMISAFFYKNYIRLIGMVGVGFLSIAPALLTVKLWMKGDPEGILSVATHHLVDLSRWLFVGRAFIEHLFFESFWGGVGILSVVVLWLNRNKIKPFERMLFCVITAFFLVFMALYVMVAHDLSWRMSVSLDRLLFQLIPTLIYLVFSCL